MHTKPNIRDKNFMVGNCFSKCIWVPEVQTTLFGTVWQEHLGMVAILKMATKIVNKLHNMPYLTL